MKNILITLLLITVCTTTNAFQPSQVERAFAAMPDEYYLSLSKKNRGKMLESYRTADTASTQQGVVKNRFGGQSQITELDTVNNYMRVENSQSGNVQLKVLPLADNQAQIALVFTACAPVCSAHISFYNSKWELLRKTSLSQLRIEDFLDIRKIKADGETVQNIAEQFDIFLIEYLFPNNSTDLEARLNSGQFMPEESYKRLKKYLRSESIFFKWENGIYKEIDNKKRQ